MPTSAKILRSLSRRAYAYLQDSEVLLQEYFLSFLAELLAGTLKSVLSDLKKAGG